MSKENRMLRKLTIVFIALTAVCAVIFRSMDGTGPLSLTIAVSVLLGLSGAFVLFCFMGMTSAPQSKGQSDGTEGWRNASVAGEKAVRNGAGTK